MMRGGAAVERPAWSAFAAPDGSGPGGKGRSAVTACEWDGGPGTYRTDALVAQEWTVRIPPPIPPRPRGWSYIAIQRRIAVIAGNIDRLPAPFATEGA